MIGIQSRWECPSCGNIIRFEDVLIETPSKVYFKGPTKCGCGRKGSFNLMDFKPMEVRTADPDKGQLMMIPNEINNEMTDFMLEKIKEKKQREVNENEN